MFRAIIPENLTRIRVHRREDHVLVDLWEPARPNKDDPHRGYIISEEQARALCAALNEQFPEGEP